MYFIVVAKTGLAIEWAWDPALDAVALIVGTLVLVNQHTKLNSLCCWLILVW
jgi:hypothetical protein